jgi:hypothetical protein
MPEAITHVYDKNSKIGYCQQARHSQKAPVNPSTRAEMRGHSDWVIEHILDEEYTPRDLPRCNFHLQIGDRFFYKVDLLTFHYLQSPNELRIDAAESEKVNRKACVPPHQSELN